MAGPAADEGRPRPDRAALAAANRALGEARAAFAEGDPVAAAEACRAGLAHRPQSIDLAVALAEAQAARGERAAARRTLEDLLERAPNRYEAVRLLAALEFDAGEEQAARRRVRAFFRARPFRPPSPDADPRAPILLRARGVEAARLSVGRMRGDGLGVRFRGGHFSLSHLIRWDRWRVMTGVWVGDAWRRTPPPAGVRLLVNTIADADREPEALEALTDFLAARPDLPVINRPERIAGTTRDASAALVGGLDGFLAPKAARVALAGRSAADAAAAVGAEIGFPAILRQPGAQSGRTVALARDAGEAEAYLAGVSSAFVYATRFVENADADGWYTKRRLFFIDGAPYPVVTHTDGVWNVHGGNRRTVMASHPWMQEKEQAFLADPKAVLGADAFAALEGLPATVGLDFFGIDFAQAPDGRLLFFEMNAAMRHSFDHANNFPYMIPYMRRISAAFDALCRRRAGLG